MGQPDTRQMATGPMPPPADAGSLFAPGEVSDHLGFALRALGRRWKLALSMTILLGAAAGFAGRLLPRSYHVESRIFALPAEGTPGAVRSQGEGPSGLAQGAAEAVVSQRRLRQLTREKELVARWSATRGPLPLLLDRAKELAGIPPPDAAARENAMVGLLAKKLTVQVKDQHVTIAFDWPDPQLAFEVVRGTEQALLDARREAELVPLERKVASLVKDAGAAQQRIDSAIAGIESARRIRRRGARSSSVRGLQAEGHFRDLPDAQLAKQRLEIVALRKSIAELEDVRRKHLSDLNATLAEQKATLGPGNPALLDTEQKLKSLGRQAAELDSLRAREQQELAAYVAAGGREIELGADASPAWPGELKEDDEAVAYGKARVGMELSTLQHLLGEMSAAQVALEAARAGFDERYVVLAPAELPDKPPSSLALWLAGALGGLLLGIFAAVAADRRGGVIREPWQAERLLSLPVLAEVEGS